MRKSENADVDKNKAAPVIPLERITHSILALRGQKVLLDSDLAALYGVATKVLLQAIKRNPRRFPDDFMLRLSNQEWAALRSQIVTLKPGRGQHRKYLPYAFTEQGVAMLSSVLNSERAISVNIEIMRAFVRMRDLLTSNKELAQKLAELERKVSGHDQAIVGILKAIRELMNPPVPKKRPIGFIELQERK
jgi:phage regulator Rha-like protein